MLSNKEILSKIELKLRERKLNNREMKEQILKEKEIERFEMLHRIRLSLIEQEKNDYRKFLQQSMIVFE